MMDPTTFGNSPCEINLAKILDKMENPSVQRKVLRLLNECSSLLKNISFINEKEGSRMSIGLAIRELTIRKIEESPTLENYPDVRSHLRTAVVKRIRKFMRGEYENSNDN